MQKSYSKIIFLSLFLLGISFFAVGETFASFGDDESSQSNIYSVANLDFKLKLDNSVTHTTNLNPDYGKDATPIWPLSYNLNASDLAKLKNSDNDRYIVKGHWRQQFSHDWDYLEFGFSDIPINANIINVKLYFEWQRDWNIDGARIKVWENGTEHIHNLTIPSSNTDKIEEINLDYIDTVEEVNNLKIWFQAHDGLSGTKTKHDWIEIEVNYTLGENSQEIDGPPGTWTISNMLPGDSVGRDIKVIKKDGSLPFKYNAQTVKISGDDNFCNALKLEAKLEGVTKYSDGLMGLNIVPPVVIGSDNQDDWLFTITLPSDTPSTLQNKSCQFKFVFDGWQTNFENSSQGFSDTEEILNTITTGRWVSPGDVVINEVMWMGSTDSSSDEWIELKNNTDYEIDISNWRIDGAVAGKSGHLEIPHGYTIPADGYFLIANKKEDKSAISDGISVDLRATEISLNNNYKKNGALVLKDKEKRVIDSTPLPIGKKWPAGTNNGLKQSMERTDSLQDGTSYDNWHTCDGEVCNDITYWDIEGDNYGTPKSANLSENGIPPENIDETDSTEEDSVSSGGPEEMEAVEEDTETEENSDNLDKESPGIPSDEENQYNEQPALPEDKEDILEELLEGESQNDGEKGNGETENPNPAPKPVDGIKAPE